MDESTLLTHVCADFMLSRTQEEKSYSAESKMKQIRSLTASLLASSASYFLISWQNPLDSSPLLWNTSSNFQNFSWCLVVAWCQFSEEQKFSRDNFRDLLKIYENHKSFHTVKLLSFTVYTVTYITTIILSTTLTVTRWTLVIFHHPIQ